MTIANADEDAKQLEHLNIAGRNSTLEKFWQVLTKLNLQVFILETWKPMSTQKPAYEYSQQLYS